MKTMFFGRKFVAALLLASAFCAFGGSIRAADSDIASRIYGSGKATLRWPDDENRADVARPEYYNGERLSYFQGTVSRVWARDYFELRASDGRSYRVVWYDDGGDFRLSTGDRVEVSGRLTRDLLIAHHYREIGSGYGYRQVDFPATVASVGSYSRVTVRGDNGRVYTVEARNRLPYNLNAGDYVRIIGTWNGSVVTAEQIIVLREGYNGGSFDRQVDFPGIVSEVDRYRNTLNVRGDNGITYSVTYTGADRFGIGDRVRVVGLFDGYTVRATSVTRR